MFMPNGDHAIVEMSKIEDYCLNPDHPRGRHKARVFKSSLGMEKADAPRLTTLLLQAAVTDQAILGENDQYGQRYTLDFSIIGPEELVTIRSIWIISTTEGSPRLVTCYVL